MLQDKVILITGASRGIGRATALLAAKNGATVIINYHNSEQEAVAVVGLIEKTGGRAVAIKADISHDEEVKEMFRKIKEDFGHLDILVNNAGVMINNLLLMTRQEEYSRIMDINCQGMFICSQHATKMMVRQKSGKIINISSVVGVYGSPGQALYAASKSFVIGFTKSLAKELGSFNITVNAVAPGFIETDLTQNTRADVRARLISTIALGRSGTPEDIAPVILFLASPMGDYISGQVIGVDGCQGM
jgi:3-oxoacyl-[acyl-carrier protein] reductase